MELVQGIAILAALLAMSCVKTTPEGSPRAPRGIEYPMHDRTITVTSCGRICINGLKINFSIVFSGQDVGVKEVSEKIWLVSFETYDLGYFDEDSKRFEPLENPFAAKVLPVGVKL